MSVYIPCEGEPPGPSVPSKQNKTNKQTTNNRKTKFTIFKGNPFLLQLFSRYPGQRLNRRHDDVLGVFFFLSALRGRRAFICSSRSRRFDEHVHQSAQLLVHDGDLRHRSVVVRVPSRDALHVDGEENVLLLLLLLLRFLFLFVAKVVGWDEGCCVGIHIFFLSAARVFL